MRPGREHDTTAARAHTEILPTLTEAAQGLRALGDLDYEGESDTITFKALRNVSLDPWRIGKIVAAALVFLHIDHAGTT